MSTSNRPTVPLESLNVRLATRRKKLCLSQTQLAKLLGISRRTLSAIEQGRAHQLADCTGTISRRHEEKIKRWLAIPEDQLALPKHTYPKHRQQRETLNSQEVATLTEKGTPFEEWPLRLRLWKLRTDRKLTLRQCASVFGVDKTAISGWEAGPFQYISRQQRGWQIPRAMQPLVLHWIETGKRPSKEAIAAAKAAQPNKKQGCILDDLPTVDIAKISKESTVNEVVAAYLQQVEFGPKKVAESNLQRKRDAFISFLPTFGEMKLSDLKAVQCELWLQQQTTWKSESTAHTALAHIRAMFMWLVDLDLLDKNPFRRVKRRPGKPRDEITVEQFQKLLRCTTTFQPVGWKKPQWLSKPTHYARLRQIVFFIWLTGARTTEARALKFSMIDWEHRLIRMSEHKTANTTKGLYAKPRVIYFDETVEKLLRWIEKHDKQEEGHVFQDYVFKHSRCEPWKSGALSLKFRRLREKAGLPSNLKPYCLRHSFASRCIRAGIDIKTVAELLGHTTTICTERYCHVAGHHDHLSAAVDKANAKLSQILSKAVVEEQPKAKPAPEQKQRKAEGGGA